MGGPVSGNTEPERDEGSETDSKMARGRQTRVRAHTTAHRHTHTEAQTERGRHRATDRWKTRDRHGRENGIRPETDTLAPTMTYLRERL